MSRALWTDAFLDRMRLKGDDEADAAVHSLYDDVINDNPEAFKRVNNLLFQLTFAGEMALDNLPKPVLEFAEKSRTLPAWADAALIKKGQEFFYRNGLGSTVLLVCAALPECYVMKNGIHALALTRFLRDRPAMRILETAQMIRDVMAPGGLNPGAKGILATQKIRLLHASIRHLILEATSLEDEDMGKVYAQTRWDYARWGQPLCQEDMAYTLQTFAYVVLRGLEDLGVPVTEEEKNAYIHCWNVAGHILGIERELLPEPPQGDATYSRIENAKLLYETIRRRQEGKTEEGVAITAANTDLIESVVSGFVEKTFLLKRIGGRKLVYVPRLLMNHLLGQETTKMLGIEVPQPNALERGLLKLVLRLVKHEERHYQAVMRIPAIGYLSEGLHLILTRHFSQLPANHKQTFLPENLQRRFDYAPLLEGKNAENRAAVRLPRGPEPPAPPLEH